MVICTILASTINLHIEKPTSLVSVQTERDLLLFTSYNLKKSQSNVQIGTSPHLYHHPIMTDQLMHHQLACLWNGSYGSFSQLIIFYFSSHLEKKSCRNNAHFEPGAHSCYRSASLQNKTGLVITHLRQLQDVTVQWRTTTCRRKLNGRHLIPRPFPPCPCSGTFSKKSIWEPGFPLVHR